jgi:hypothetical protein
LGSSGSCPCNVQAKQLNEKIKSSRAMFFACCFLPTGSFG